MNELAKTSFKAEPEFVPPQYMEEPKSSKGPQLNSSVTPFADRSDTRTADRNYQALVGLYAGDDAAVVRAALAEKLAPKTFWQRLGRLFGGEKTAPVRITDEIAFYPPLPGYCGYEGYCGFAYVREATSYLEIARIPDEMMAESTLANRARDGMSRLAASLRNGGELEIIEEFKGGVAT